MAVIRKKRTAGDRRYVDPFGERAFGLYRERLPVLGGVFDFESNSRPLLRLVRWAYAGLPSQRLSPVMPRFRIRVVLSSERQAGHLPGEPPPLQLYSGAGILSGVTGSSSFVAMSPTQRDALVVVAPDMLGFPYHIRYELIEFAVFTLATRAQGLAALHAACVGIEGRGLLLVGESGSGKSTLALHCLLQGFDFVAEDSVFVQPQTLLATGVGNFLHVRSDSLRFLAGQRAATAIRKSPVITRRSGVEKFEVDVRRPAYRIARTPQKLAAVVFATARQGAAGAVLNPLGKKALLARLNASQPYGASRPEWSAFRRSVSRLPAFELHRGSHPREAVELVRDLLARLAK